MQIRDKLLQPVRQLPFLAHPLFLISEVPLYFLISEVPLCPPSPLPFRPPSPLPRLRWCERNREQPFAELEGGGQGLGFRVWGLGLGV